MAFDLMAFLRTIVVMLTGCGCFLVGINLMSRGFLNICKRPGSKLLNTFRPNNGIEGVFNGMIHSMLVQSSSSTAILTIKLLNVSAITLLEATTIIMGANIGTTITAILASMSSLNISIFFAFFTFIGSVLFLSNNPTKRIVGEILAGFGLVFVGLDTLNLYTKDPQVSSVIMQIFSLTQNPFLLVVFGMIITAIFQSSSVSTSIMVVMVNASLLPFKESLFIVLGANVGACITSIIACNGGNVNTKRIAFINVFFNLIGVILFFLLLFFFEDAILSFIGGINVSDGFKLAIFHLLFNLLTTIILLPFVKVVVWISKKLIVSYR